MSSPPTDQPLDPRTLKRLQELERSLQTAEAQFRGVVYGAAEGIVVVQHERIVLANPYALRMFGATADEVAAAHYLDFTHPDDHPLIHDRYRRRMAGEDVGETVDYRLISPSRAVTHVRAHTTVIEWHGEPANLVFLTDLTELHRSQEILRESEERYRLLFQNANDAVYLIAPETGAILDANDQACRMLGYDRETLVAMDRRSLVAPESAARAPDRLEEIRRTGHQRFESEHVARDGTRIPVDVATRLLTLGSRSVVLVVARDLTERKRAERERQAAEDRLQQSRRLEAIGLLAGGVAHDFNNMLAAILGYAELARDALDPTSPIRDDITQIISAGDRSRELVKQLLAFARRQTLEMKSIDLNELVAGLEPLLRRTLPENMRLTLELNGGACPVLGDPGQIEQVVLNLVINARDAMSSGGLLTLRTALRTIDPELAAVRGGVAPGVYVCLEVRDTGIGMDTATLTRIFEPFFTTRRETGGTGLGLATSYGIVRQHHGTIWAESEPGAGSVFHVCLPLSELDAVAPPRPSSGENRRGSETILIAEDQEQARKLVATMLERHGYRVLTAPDGAQTLVIARDQPEVIHLLVTDMLLSDIDGVELYLRARELRPELRVLYMSGHTPEMLLKYVRQGGDQDFLQKPFSMQALTERVRRVLDRPPA